MVLITPGPQARVLLGVGMPVKLLFWYGCNVVRVDVQKKLVCAQMSYACDPRII